MRLVHVSCFLAAAQLAAAQAPTKLRLSELQLDSDGDSPLTVLDEAFIASLARTSEFVVGRPQTLYVSAQGSDVSGNGSIAAPWATLARAQQFIIGSGDTDFEVQLSPGSWVLDTEDGVIPSTKRVWLIASAPGCNVEVIADGYFDEIDEIDVPDIVYLSGARGVDFTVGTSDGEITNSFVALRAAAGEASFYEDCTFTVPADHSLWLGLTGLTSYRDCTITADASAAGLSIFGKAWTNGSITAPALSTNLYGAFSNARITTTSTSAAALTLWAYGLNSCKLAVGTMSARIPRINDSQIVATGGIELDQFHAVQDSFISGTSVYLKPLPAGGELSVRGNVIASTQHNQAGYIIDLRSLTSSVSRMVIDGNDITYTGADDENNGTGNVGVIVRLGSFGNLIVNGNHIRSRTSRIVFNSHPIADTYRATNDQNFIVTNNFFEVIRSAEDGAPDANGVIVNYARGTFYTANNILRMDAQLATKLDAEYSAMMHEANAGAPTVVYSFGDTFELKLPNSASYTARRYPIIFRETGSASGNLSAYIYNPTILQSGSAVQGSFGGLGGSNVTVSGPITSNTTVTFENAPSGSFTRTRDALQLDGNVTLGGTLTAASLGSVTPTSIIGRSSGNVLGTVTTIPDSFLPATAVLTTGSQTISGAKVFSSGATSSVVRWIDIPAGTTVFEEVEIGNPRWRMAGTEVEAIPGITETSHYIALPPMSPGTVIRQVRYKAERGSEDSGISGSLQRRDDSTTGSSWTTVASLTGISGAGTFGSAVVTTTDIADHTVLAGNVYRLSFSATLLSGTVILYSGGIETEGRGL